MPSIAASSAVMIRDKVLPQHQVALSIIKDRLESPSVGSFRWLDLCCGRGQVLVHAAQVIGTNTAAKVEYIGIDVDQRYARETEERARRLFPSVKMQICHIHEFERLLDVDDLFDFITLTNSCHEITPDSLARTIVAAICRLREQGQAFIYDMEQLPSLELGAIPWTAQEVESIIHAILKAAGEARYLPSASQWIHSTCSAWSVHLNRSHFSLSADALATSRDLMEKSAAFTITEILRQKLFETNSALESLAEYGAEDSSESVEAERLSYNFWAISRALARPVILIE